MVENVHAKSFLRTMVEAVNNVQHLVIDTKKNPLNAHENISAATAVACMTLSDMVESSAFKHFIEDTAQRLAPAMADVPSPTQDQSRWRDFLNWQRLALLSEGVDEAVVDDALGRYWECHGQPTAEILLAHIKDIREVACHASFIAKGHFSEVEAIRFVDRIGLGVIGTCIVTAAGYIGLTDRFIGAQLAPPGYCLGAGMVKKAVDGFKTQ